MLGFKALQKRNILNIDFVSCKLWLMLLLLLADYCLLLLLQVVVIDDAICPNVYFVTFSRCTLTNELSNSQLDERL